MGGPPRPSGNNNRQFQQRRRNEPEHMINEYILFDEIRLVGENIESGIYTYNEAMTLANEEGVDLVCITPNANPPVCRVVDYKKFLFEQKKKAKEVKANSAISELKEIRFGPNTDDHDFNFKVKHAQKFLEEGDKIKAYVHFKGRAIVYKERGEILLLKFAQELEELARVDQLPKLEGKRMFLLLSPKTKKK